MPIVPLELASPETVTDETLVLAPAQGLTAQDADRIPLSFEVSGAASHESAYEQYAHALKTVLESFDPLFVSIDRASDVSPLLLTPDIAIVREASEHAPVGKIVPKLGIEGQSNSDEAAFKEELREYAAAGVERILISPPVEELKSGEVTSEPIIDLLHIARDVRKFKAIGVVMRVGQGPQGPYEFDSDYQMLAEQLQLADFGLTQPLLYTEPYRVLTQVMSEVLEEPKPIIPGLKPFSDPRQAAVYAADREIEFPAGKLDEQLVEAEINLEGADRQAYLRSLMIQHTVELGHELIKIGAPSLHFYTSNNMRLTQAVVEQLRAQHN